MYNTVRVAQGPLPTVFVQTRLKAARQAAGISLSGASRLLGVSETSVKSLEASASPQLGSIARWAAMCGVHPSELIEYVEVD